MEPNIYTEYLSKHRESAKAKNAALSDDEMSKAQGGVGGANEATCPYCGKAMKPGNYPDVGKGWRCDDCKLTTDCSDAEYIQIIRYMEQSGITDISYPVWWNQVQH